MLETGKSIKQKEEVKESFFFYFVWSDVTVNRFSIYTYMIRLTLWIKSIGIHGTGKSVDPPPHK